MIWYTEIKNPNISFGEIAYFAAEVDADISYNYPGVGLNIKVSDQNIINALKGKKISLWIDGMTTIYTQNLPQINPYSNIYYIEHHEKVDGGKPYHGYDAAYNATEPFIKELIPLFHNKYRYYRTNPENSIVNLHIKITD